MFNSTLTVRSPGLTAELNCFTCKCWSEMLGFMISLSRIIKTLIKFDRFGICGVTGFLFCLSVCHFFHILMYFQKVRGHRHLLILQVFQSSFEPESK